MTEKRKQVTTICDSKYEYLIAAGGRNKDGPTNTVEVLTLKTRKWSTVTSLPHKSFRASACISGDDLYILGGCIYDEESNQIEVKSVFRASLSKLIRAQDSVFQEIADLPHVRAVCTTFNNQIFAIGGTKHGGISTNRVYLYEPEDNPEHNADVNPEDNPKRGSWKQVSTLLYKSLLLFCCLPSHIPNHSSWWWVDNTSQHDEGCTNSVEITELNV